MKLPATLKISSAIGGAVALAFSMLTFTGFAANADQPVPPAEVSFGAPACAGTTDYDPVHNTGFAVTDLTQVFGERLASYNAGNIVPLYDAFGGSILLAADGTNTGQDAYPPVCGTRYVASVGAAVSEWMFCTDRAAQSCGDTDKDGNLVAADGEAINPPVSLPRNPKLTTDQERLIAYLIQEGHQYAGTGNQAWGDVAQARSDLGSNERAALQTLVWCISDPSTEANDFATTCEQNMGAVEQARLLALIPKANEAVLGISGPSQSLNLGQTAEFTVNTNVFGQAINIVEGGTAAADWSVCGGDAVIKDSTLTVAGTDASVAKDVKLCATGTSAGTVTLSASVTPPTTEHIGWSQSVNDRLAKPCQVYATFHEAKAVSLNADGQAVFEAVASATPTTATPTTTEPAETTEPAPTTGAAATTPAAALAATGVSGSLMPLLLGLGLALAGGSAVAVSARRSSKHS